MRVRLTGTADPLWQTRARPGARTSSPPAPRACARSPPCSSGAAGSPRIGNAGSVAVAVTRDFGAEPVVVGAAGRRAGLHELADVVGTRHGGARERDGVSLRGRHRRRLAPVRQRRARGQRGPAKVRPAATGSGSTSSRPGRRRSPRSWARSPSRSCTARAASASPCASSARARERGVRRGGDAARRPRRRRRRAAASARAPPTRRCASSSGRGRQLRATRAEACGRVDDGPGQQRRVRPLQRRRPELDVLDAEGEVATTLGAEHRARRGDAHRASASRSGSSPAPTRPASRRPRGSLDEADAAHEATRWPSRRPDRGVRAVPARAADLRYASCAACGSGCRRRRLTGERRVALVPEVIRKLVARDLEVVVESGAGEGAMLPDAAFTRRGRADRRPVGAPTSS